MCKKQGWKDFWKRIGEWFKKVWWTFVEWLKQVFMKVEIITKEDWDAFISMNKKNQEEIWEAMDSDGDGKITPADIAKWFKDNK